MKELDLEAYLTASGRYPERIKSAELTSEVLTNAARLLSAVRCLLQDLGYKAPVDVTSGFRPSAVNAAIGNASKKSLHTLGLAVDLMDDRQQTLGKLIAASPEKLKLYKLFIEDIKYTKGANTNWVHLDLSPTRADRSSRSFVP